MRHLFAFYGIIKVVLCLVMLLSLFTLTFATENSIPEFKTATPELRHFRDGIPNFLDKCTRGEDVAIAYFGGSITAADGWRPQTLEKFREQFENIHFTEINAAIGGTGSNLGAYRLNFDVLRHNPDLVFVEFAVNDDGDSPENIWRQVEGIVRQIWNHNLNTDIVFVYTFAVGHQESYLNGKTTRSVSAMEQIADFYGIPSFDFNIPVVDLQKEGKLTFVADVPEEGKILFSTDGVHPLKEGHQIYTSVVCDSFEQMKEVHKNRPYPASKERARKLEKVFISDNYENAKMVSIEQSQLSGNWELLSDESSLAWIKSRLGETVFTSDEPGAKLSFQFKGSDVAIYDVLGPNAGQVNVTIDGKKNEWSTPRFDSYCTYHRLATLGVANGLDSNAVHTVEIEIDEKQPDRQSVAFRLENPEKELAGPKYNGRRVWFGSIMIRGDIVK